MLTSIVYGWLVSGGLIIAIGAQNAFVLGQGLRREHGWLVAGVCAGCDGLLIALGILGAGALLAEQAGLMLLARWGGALFLAWQAWLALCRVRRPRGLVADGGAPGSPGRALLATLAVTLLNPQVYLETLVVLGSLGAMQPSPGGFLFGASLASLGWFFGLVAAAGWLAPRLVSRRAWQVVDGVTALVMAGVAGRLASGGMIG
ncbi:MULTISPECIES: LysE family transporter [Halomonas]|uniref:LysE family transporter n=1 Tax=Halomonas flagellata TaxID=2920385 RepID=A0ABS9RUG7_9GAMM|nr:LysE family transporter [Halomonas sp. LBP4]MCH4563510.1 LysE family transporter [Halomonas flagellata]